MPQPAPNESPRAGNRAGSHPVPGRRRLAGSRISQLGIAVTLIAVGAAVALLVAHGSRGPAPARAVALGTAVVRRGDLVETRHYHGRLSFPSRGTAHLTGTGTVTSLPRVGETLTEGAPIAGIDDRPIGILYGPSPLYRTLGAVRTSDAQLAVATAHADVLGAEAAVAAASTRSRSAARAARLVAAQVSLAQARDRMSAATGSLTRAQTPQEGPDVALVARAMATLGYLPQPTDRWSEALSLAVSRWQQHIGAPPSGHLSPADTVVLAGAARVSAVQGQTGDAPSLVAISLSTPTRLATFVVHGAVPAALRRGRSVRLSGAGSSVTGRVTRLQAGERSTVVEITFPRAAPLTRAASPVVSMSVTVADRRNVLIVPTQALLALASGGYALQLPGGRLLAVRTGVVQGDDVEVTGRGVHPGLRIVSVS